MSMMSLSQKLQSLDITNDWVGWDDLLEAIEWAEQNETATHRRVLTVYREATSPWSGDEIEDTGIIAAVETEEVCFYWRENAGGMARAAVGRMPLSDIGDWLSKQMEELDYTFNQFVGCELTNHAPELLPKAKVYALVEAALARGDADEEERPLPQWFAEQYEE